MQRFKSILAVVDCSTEPLPRLERPIQLAMHDRARLKIVDVVRDFGWLRRIAKEHHAGIQQQLVQEKAEVLEGIAQSARTQGIATTTKVLVGKSSSEIIREVLRGKHDLVIKDAKGGMWFKGFFGATGLELLRKCPCPVWLTKPEPYERNQYIMAAVNATHADKAHAELNQKIMKLATSLCQRDSSRLAIVHAWEVFGENVLEHHLRNSEFQELMKRNRTEAEQSFNAWLSSYGLNQHSPGVHLLHGDPTWTLPLFAEREGIDLIVMGTIARTGIAGALMGNTSEAIVRSVRCSVLAIKPDAFVSPITLEH